MKVQLGLDVSCSGTNFVAFELQRCRNDAVHLGLAKVPNGATLQLLVRDPEWAQAELQQRLKVSYIGYMGLSVGLGFRLMFLGSKSRSYHMNDIEWSHAELQRLLKICILWELCYFLVTASSPVKATNPRKKHGQTKDYYGTLLCRAL